MCIRYLVYSRCFLSPFHDSLIWTNLESFAFFPSSDTLILLIIGVGSSTPLVEKVLFWNSLRPDGPS